MEYKQFRDYRDYIDILIFSVLSKSPYSLGNTQKMIDNNKEKMKNI